MDQSSWSCPHSKEEICEIIKKACSPGDKGCVLYAKARFSNENSPSNEAFEKRMERKMKAMLKDIRD